MTTALATTEKKKEQSGLTFFVKQPFIESRFREVLKDRAPQFISSLISLTNANKALKEADPRSIVAAAMTAATLDLPIQKDLGFAHIVPYKGKAQFQMGYKGYIQLAMRWSSDVCSSDLHALRPVRADERRQGQRRGVGRDRRLR